MKYELEVEFHKDFIKVEGNKIVVGLTRKPEKRNKQGNINVRKGKILSEFLNHQLTRNFHKKKPKYLVNVLGLT